MSGADFGRDLERGKVWEAWFEGWVRKEMRCNIEKVGLATDKAGVDLVLRIAAQVKADVVAAETGNAFIETWSDKERGVRGWAYTTEDYVRVFYMVPPKGRIYQLDMRAVRRLLPAWELEYREVAKPNARWTTWGLLVPLSVIQEKVCEAVWPEPDLLAAYRKTAA